MSAPIWAQDAPTALPDFEAQRKTLSAVRVGTLDELRDTSKALVGKTIELRGLVKGAFSGRDSMSLLLQLPDGQTQRISATPSFSTSPAARSNSWVRVLCRVQASFGNEVVLQLLNVSGKRDAATLDASDDDAMLAVPQNVPGAPPPDAVVIGPEVDLGSSIVPAPGGAPVVLLPSRPSVSLAPAPVPSASTPSARAPKSAPRANAFYGFDSASRAAFRALAQRTNPRLSEESAEYIAASLLEAAQSHNLDPRFLASVVQVESGFNPYAVSHAGAMGLGQLMPFNLRPLGVGDAWDARQNLHGAAKLLRQNLNVYARDPNGTMLAVAAYHAGVGAVNRAGKSIPKATTQKYVWKVYYAYRALAPELFR